MDEEIQAEGPRLPRTKLAMIVAPIVVLSAVGIVTTFATPYLSTRHPLLLIVLEARNRNLILARHVDLVPFLVVGSLRRILTDPLYFLLGWYYGDRTVRWLEVKAGLGSYARVMERIFRKAAYPAVFLFPGAIICALAGVVRMRFAAFLAVNVAGTLAAVITLKVFGDVFAGPVNAVLGFFDRHLLLSTLIFLGLALVSVFAGRAEAKLSMKDIDDLESGDFEDEEAERPSE